MYYYTLKYTSDSKKKCRISSQRRTVVRSLGEICRKVRPNNATTPQQSALNLAGWHKTSHRTCMHHATCVRKSGKSTKHHHCNCPGTSSSDQRKLIYELSKYYQTNTLKYGINVSHGWQGEDWSPPHLLCATITATCQLWKEMWAKTSRKMSSKNDQPKVAANQKKKHLHPQPSSVDSDFKGI